MEQKEAKDRKFFPLVILSETNASLFFYYDPFGLPYVTAYFRNISSVRPSVPTFEIPAKPGNFFLPKIFSVHRGDNENGQVDHK